MTTQSLSNIAANKWSIREKLCLAGTIASLGNQNWSSISHNMILLCGKESDRPPDWFSQNNCAAQYEKLLQEQQGDVSNVDESHHMEKNVSQSEENMKVPKELNMKYLIDARIEELKARIREDQEEYAKITTDISAVESDRFYKDELLQMWAEMKNKSKSQDVNELKQDDLNTNLENEKIQSNTNNQELELLDNSNSKDITSSTENIGTEKSILSNNTHCIQLQTSGTSSLLSVLLKSSAAGGCITTNNTNTTNTFSIRTTAPTITTLLTGGIIPNANHPAIIPSRNDAVRLLTRPLSGPPLESTPSIQNTLSPSQSAPTLSMLLEKTKNFSNLPIQKIDLIPIKTNFTETSQCEYSNNKSVLNEIDTNADKSVDDVLQYSEEAEETDPIEEQQLLEVFKNIGNIEELDIDVSDVIDDEEVDFLKSVTEEISEHTSTNNVKCEKQIEETKDTEAIDDINNKSSDSIKLVTDETSEKDDKQQNVNIDIDVEKEKNIHVTKMETVSSDDSIDNIPLANVVSLESPSKELPITTDLSPAFNSNNASDDKSIVFAYMKVESQELVEESENIEEKVEEITQEIDLKVEEEIYPKETTIVLDYEKMETVITTGTDVQEIEMKEVKAEKIKSEFIEASNINRVILADNITEDTKCEEIVKNDDNNYVNESTDVKNIQREIIEDPKQQEQKFINTHKTELIELASECSSSDALSVSKVQEDVSSVCIAETDDDSSTADDTAIRRNGKQTNNNGNSKNKIHQSTISNEENTQPTITPISMITGTTRNSTIRNLRDLGLSESPLIDDDISASENISSHRLRRRYSSTPVIDSLPNSPASSDRDDRDSKISKKLLISIFNLLHTNRNIEIIQKIFTKSSSGLKMEDVCLRPMDFATIKKNIDTGVIRTINELQRDYLLMCTNALMITRINSPDYKALTLLYKECQTIKEFMPNGCMISKRLERDGKLNPSITKGRSGSRKGLRNS